MNMDILSVIKNNRKGLNHCFNHYKELVPIQRELLQDTGIQQYRNQYPIIGTGHQPTIYYPGLLFKNFYAAELARQSGGKAVNFIVDSDIANYRIPIPYQVNDHLYKKQRSIENSQNKIYRDFHPASSKVYHFLDETTKNLQSLSEPRIKQAFDQYKEQFFAVYQKHQNFTETINNLRSRFDASRDIHLHDIKLSHIAQTTGYYRFLHFLLKHLERFSQIYNHAVEENKSKQYQPVKSLGFDQGWYELPYWLIKHAKRYPIWVKKDQQAFHFSSRNAGLHINISRENTRSEASMIAELKDKMALYPKATTLTIMIRLFFCDTFVHGTGAIAYERVNNRFLTEFFGLDTKPIFYAVTGDIYLPIIPYREAYNGIEQDYKRNQKWLRNVERNPEEYLPKQLSKRFKQEKKQLARQMQQEKDPEERNKLHLSMNEKNKEMKNHLHEEIQKVKQRLKKYEEMLNNKNVYAERQYPYFIYPSDHLTNSELKKNISVRIIPHHPGTKFVSSF